MYRNFFPRYFFFLTVLFYAQIENVTVTMLQVNNTMKQIPSLISNILSTVTTFPICFGTRYFIVLSTRPTTKRNVH